jgi:hypothetical protein
MTLEARAQSALKEMFTEIDTVDVENIKLNGVTIRAGNKLVRLEVVHEGTIEIEDEIREEYRLKLREKLQEIKTRLNDKINDVVQMTSRIRQEAEVKERELKEKLQRVKAMPEITWAQAKQGVSIVQGETRDEICYLIRGVYYPKFVNERPLDPIYAKKLIAPVIFFFRTKNSRITEFSTRKPQNLEYFPHYHQQRPDCWGQFKYEKEFRSVDDLLKIKNAAEAVLENVNIHSIANANPRGLPRKATLTRHVVGQDEKKKKMPKATLTTDQIRHGLGDGIRSSENDVWTV